MCDSLYCYTHFIAMVWNRICNISEVCCTGYVGSPQERGHCPREENFQDNKPMVLEKTKLPFDSSTLCCRKPKIMVERERTLLHTTDILEKYFSGQHWEKKMFYSAPLLSPPRHYAMHCAVGKENDTVLFSIQVA